MARAAAGKGLLVLLRLVGGAALLVLAALAGIQSRRQVGRRPRSILAFRIHELLVPQQSSSMAGPSMTPLR